MKRFLLVLLSCLFFTNIYAVDIVAYGYGITPEEATVRAKNELASSIKVDVYNSVYTKTSISTNTEENVYLDESIVSTDLELFGVHNDEAVKISDGRYKVVAYISEESLGFYEQELKVLNKRLAEWSYLKTGDIRSDFENVKSVLNNYRNYNVYKYIFYMLNGKAWTELYPIEFSVSDVEFEYNLLISSYMKEILRDLAEIEANEIFSEKSSEIQDIKQQLQDLKAQQENNLRLRNIRLENFKNTLDSKNQEYVEMLQIIEQRERSIAETVTIDSVYNVLKQFDKRIEDIRNLERQQLSDMNRTYNILCNNIYYDSYVVDYYPFETIGFKGVPQDKAVQDRINKVKTQVEELDKSFSSKKEKTISESSSAINDQISAYGKFLKENNGREFINNNIGGDVITKIEGFDMDSLTWYGNAYIDILGKSLVIPFEFSYSEWGKDSKEFNELNIHELTEIFLAIPFSYEVEITYKFKVDFIERNFQVNVFSLSVKEPISGDIINHKDLDITVSPTSFIRYFKVSDANLFRIIPYIQSDYAFSRAGASLKYIGEMEFSPLLGCKFEWIPATSFAYSLFTGIGVGCNNLGNIIENVFLEFGCDVSYTIENFYMGVGVGCDVGVFVDPLIYDSNMCFAIPSLYLNGGYVNDDFSIGLFCKLGYELSDRIMKVDPSYRSSIGLNFSYTVFDSNEK